jgi:hypothetical protein
VRRWSNTPFVSALGALAACIALAGCGGSRPTVAGCLSAKGFLVQGVTTIRGTSAAGVTFTLRIYATRVAAVRAFTRRDGVGVFLIGAAVIDDSGNPPASPGAAPGKLSKHALAEIRSCLVDR